MTEKYWEPIPADRVELKDNDGNRTITVSLKGGEHCQLRGLQCYGECIIAIQYGKDILIEDFKIESKPYAFQFDLTPPPEYRPEEDTELVITGTGEFSPVIYTERILP